MELGSLFFSVSIGKGALSRLYRFIVIFLPIESGMRATAIVVPILGVVLGGCQPTQNKYEPPPPPKVTAAKPLQQTVTLFLEKTGQTEAVENAEVRCRVRGFIEDIKFQPGQTVEAGKTLYVIEKDLYRAEKDSAEAAVLAAKAAVAVAEGTVEVQQAEVKRADQELKRQESLKAQNATSIAEYDTAVAAKNSADANLVSAEASVEAATADVAQAEAKLDQAELDFGYTDVLAPISGRISKTDTKLGNLVQNGDSLASIVNVDQIFVNFTVSDREVLRMQKVRLKKEPKRGDEIEPEDWYKIPLFVRRETDESFPFVGHLEYFDTEGVDAETGTLAMRGVFENPEELIFPGLFVHIRIPIAQSEGALLVPEKAVGRNDLGVFVLVVDDQQKVQQKLITTGQQLDGWVVVEKGITADDMVIIDGLQRARPGTEVTPIETELNADDSPFIQFEMPEISPTAPKDSQDGDQPEPQKTEEPAEEPEPKTTDEDQPSSDQDDAAGQGDADDQDDADNSREADEN